MFKRRRDESPERSKKTGPWYVREDEIDEGAYHVTSSQERKGGHEKACSAEDVPVETLWMMAELALSFPMGTSGAYFEPGFMGNETECDEFAALTRFLQISMDTEIAAPVHDQKFRLTEQDWGVCTWCGKHGHGEEECEKLKCGLCDGDHDVELCTSHRQWTVFVVECPDNKFWVGMCESLKDELSLPAFLGEPVRLVEKQFNIMKRFATVMVLKTWARYAVQKKSVDNVFGGHVVLSSYPYPRRVLLCKLAAYLTSTPLGDVLFDNYLI